MLAEAIKQSPFVHLAIDFDSTNLENLSESRRKQVVGKVRDFANRLRHHAVPTLWISFPRASRCFELYAAEATGSSKSSLNRPRSILQQTGFESDFIRTDKDIFVKGAADAFASGDLANICV